MEEPMLDYLFWEATLRCNLRCRHCGSDCGPYSQGPELTTEQVLAAFDTVAEDFDPEDITVTITGGEPLVRKDVFDVASHLARLGFFVSMVTNGTLVTKEVARRLKDSGVEGISVSIDGLESSHEYLRGRGTYDKALQAVEHLASAGIEAVEVISTVWSRNLGELEDMERTYRAAGANLWRLITIDRMGRAEQDEEFWLDPAGVNALFDFIETRRKGLARSGEDFHVSFSCGGFLGVRREDVVRPMNWECSAGLTVGSILADGSASACPSLPRSWAQGNVLERRFSDIWYSEFQDFRSHNFRRQGPCASCSWYPFCLGGGIHERLAQPDAFCWLDRQGL